MDTPDKNPDDYCIRCQWRYGLTDENCVHCGFDPVNSEEHENENEIARHLWRVKTGVERQ